ncbi:hypothetical protein ACIOUE_03795 [Streptomyces xanthochromogenes]|uniref:hypothetical protein n=1 Tax=Streptomyces TaxID=1883 RepID=UPI0013718A28|nr:hypothetical protein [Streptomyces sp. SID1034]MYV90320.1 hypothetical protein [Streptomyces sp. SID1034]
MYETFLDDEDWGGSTGTLLRRPYAEQRVYRATSMGHLSALRREIKAAAISVRGDRPVITDLYALGVEPVNSHLRAQVYAESQGFTVGHRFSDPDGAADPTQRPGWLEMCSHIAGGFAHGIVVVGASDISTDPDEVEITLRWAQTHCAFVDFVLAPFPVPAQTRQVSGL